MSILKGYSTIRRLGWWAYVLFAYRSLVAAPSWSKDSGTAAFGRAEIERECIDRPRVRTLTQAANFRTLRRKRGQGLPERI
jgi:hypothetical protein